MNDLQIDYFLAVAENMSFTKTADQLYVTQSAISKQIASMEEELGVTLFDRTRRQIKLTEAGELFFRFYKNCREQFLKTVQEAKKADGNRTGKLVIGYLEYWSLSRELIQTIQSFSEEFPDVKVWMECMSVRELVSGLKNDRLDMILTVGDAVLKSPDIIIQKLVHIPRILLLSKNHPLAKKKDLNLEDLRNETFFTFDDQGEHIRSFLGERYGGMPDIQIVKNMESAIACARNGMGAVVTNVWTSVTGEEDFVHLSFPLDHEIVLVRKAGAGKKLSGLLADKLMENLGKNKNEKAIF